MIKSPGAAIQRSSRTPMIAFPKATLALLCVLSFLVSTSGTVARSPDREVCLQWAEIAAREQEVPVALMKAIATVESGRGNGNSRVAWPWAVNSGGRGYWFGTASEAISFVSARLERGYRNIDVGCFQVNVRWHGEGFTNLASMLEPADNARYAARFLKDLRRELGSWEKAAEAYHSRTPEHAMRYRELLQPVLARFGGMSSASARTDISTDIRIDTGAAAPTDPAGARVGALASLVPLGFQAPARPLF